MKNGYGLKHGECQQVLKDCPDDYFDSCVTDPPYALEFMGKGWDKVLPDIEVWKEVYRTLKPGGYLLAFGGTRTYHRLVCNIEDAGFEIRDCIMWLYGSGFPKGSATDVNIWKELTSCLSKESVQYAVQCSTPILLESPEGKQLIAVVPALIQPGGEKVWIILTGEAADSLEVTAMCSLGCLTAHTTLNIEWLCGNTSVAKLDPRSMYITETTSKVTIDQRTWKFFRSLTMRDYTIEGKTLQNGVVLPACDVVRVSREERAKLNPIPILSVVGSATSNICRKWAGYNVALKPAFEPIVIARKPLGEKTVAANVLKYGTGAINVDGCRVPGEPWKAHDATGLGSVKFFTEGETPIIHKEPHGGGRWPANVIHDGSEEVLDEFAKYGDRKGAPLSAKGKGRKGPSKNVNVGGGQINCVYGDDGSAARFFYAAKASKKEKNIGCGDLLTWDGVDLHQRTEHFVQLVKDTFGSTTLPVRDIASSMSWSGSSITEPSQKVIKCITETVSKLIIESRTWNSSHRLNISDCIQDAIETLKGCGLSPAESVEIVNQSKQSSTEGKTASVRGVVLAALQMLVSLRDEARTGNIHNTVKPVSLMRYLCRMVTQPGGLILDPFVGSGSTIEAGLREGFQVVGIDAWDEAYQTAKARAKAVVKELKEQKTKGKRS